MDGIRNFEHQRSLLMARRVRHMDVPDNPRSNTHARKKCIPTIRSRWQTRRGFLSN